MTLQHSDPWLKTTRPKWLTRKYVWTSGNLDYKGYSLKAKASTSEGDLYWIKKYTWDGSDNPTSQEGYFRGNWDDRATLSDWA